MHPQLGGRGWGSQVEGRRVLLESEEAVAAAVLVPICIGACISVPCVAAQVSSIAASIDQTFLMSSVLLIVLMFMDPPWQLLWDLTFEGGQIRVSTTAPART